MKRLLFIFLLLFSTFESYCCSCSYERITQEEYDNYSLIFIGEIIEVEDCDNKGYQKFTFESKQIFKGQTTKLVSGFNNCGGVCNYSYKLGQKWLVYSNPKYGLINDSHACNQSTLISNEKNKVLIGPDYNISKKDWEFEIDFLQIRKTKNTKIVNFQFVKFIPLLKTLFIVSIIIAFFLLCFRFRVYLVPYSIGLGIISGILYYAMIIKLLSPKFISVKIIHISLVFSFLLLSNFIYFIWKKDKLNFKKSFIFNFLTYLSINITTTYIIISNEHQEIEYNQDFYKVFFIILGIGIPLSFFTTIVLWIKKNIQLKIKKNG